MKIELELVKSLLLPSIAEDINEVNKIIDWQAITSGFIAYEFDTKPLYAEVYKLELSDPEKIIAALDELHEKFLEDNAEEFVLGRENAAITELMRQDSSMFYQKVAFFKELKNVITKQERKKILQQLPSYAERFEISISESEIENAIKKKSRDDLKAKFSQWDKELEVKETKGRVVTLSWMKYAAVAAIIIVGFFTWQPTQTSNENLFSEYYSNPSSYNKLNIQSLIVNTADAGERGSEDLFKNYTKIESDKILKALRLFQETNFDQAKKILTEANPRGNNSDLLIFLAISQLNTNDVDKAIGNLKFLNRISDYKYPEDVRFHLAMAFIKKGENSEAKKLLKDLSERENKYTSESKEILRKMRWF